MLYNNKGVDERYKFYVVHADALEDAKGIVANLKEVFGNIEVELNDLSPVFVTQGGPQCIAIQYIEKIQNKINIDGNKTFPITKVKKNRIESIGFRTAPILFFFNRVIYKDVGEFLLDLW